MPRHDQAATLDREARAIELRRNGATYPQIAERLSISEAGARKIVKRVLDRMVTEAVPDVRKLELDRLDQLHVQALLVLQREHVVVSAGKPVLGFDGRPMRDDGPTLQAIRTILTIQERRARLLGLDAPLKQDITVRTEDEYQRELEEVRRQLAELPVPTPGQLTEPSP